MERFDNWNNSREDILRNGSGTEKLYPVNDTPGKWRKFRPWFIIAVVLAVLAAAGGVVGALIAKNIIHIGSKATTSSDTSSPGSPHSGTNTPGAGGTNTPLSTPCTSSNDIPSTAKGTWTDQTSWLDMTDFNCTFTDETVGGLPIAGLNSTWDDSKQANQNVPPLNQPWGSYSGKPLRGVNLGGWFSLEPFITPSLFNWDPTLVDEWTLCSKLGPQNASATLEKHYSTFITEADFQNIAAAGLDHVRIPFSYWAVTTYDGDPYVFGVSWRYLLRAIEWARKYGLRVNLDLHGVPGSQNGWNHSGKQGTVDWLVGPDGATNAQRTLDIHKQLSTFFAQDRYKNIIVFYGLVNEPSQTIPQSTLITWTQQAYTVVQNGGVTATQVIGDAMLGLGAWVGKLPGYGTSLAIDAHLYAIFDNGLIGLKHADRVAFACNTWTAQMGVGMNGFGPTMAGEWSQADTDCVTYLNGVGQGARWIGTFSGGTKPLCPTADSECNCDMANADPSTFTSDYKQFLLTFAEAQMTAYETSWGWFYWTWKTESAPLWSYQAALQGNFMPPVAYQRSWNCSQAVPSFGSLPEFY